MTVTATIAMVVGVKQVLIAMTIGEAAKRISVSPSKLYQLVADRKIAHYRVGGKIVLLEADVESFMAACRVDAVQTTAHQHRTRLNLKHIALGDGK